MTTTSFSGGRVLPGATVEAAEWLLVRDDVVEAVGEGDAPAADRRVDLDGAVLVPGLRDGHVHLPTTGLYATGMDFRGERAAAAIVAAFSRRAGRQSGVLFGGNFEEPLDAPITRDDLDRAVGARAALLARADMHSCIVSTALLDVLDVDGVEGVDRDAAGTPTGYLRERAASEAWRWFDAHLTPQQQRDAVLEAVRIAYSRGVVEAHEMFVVEWRGWDSAERLLETVRAVSLNVPVYLATDEVGRVRDMGFRRVGGDWFLDGSFGSHTAWMKEPYDGAPPPGSTPTGTPYRSDEQVERFFRAAQDNGMQAGVHAIGDASIEQAIAAWERVASKVGVDPVRERAHRIEHFECASDDHIARAAALGLRASVQPAFDRFWGGHNGMYASRIGWRRARNMNRFRHMLGAGLGVGGGSDSTVTPLDPFLQMAALRDHHVAEESLSARDALEVMTAGVAGLAPDEGARGVLAPGTWADLALVDRDPLETAPDELLETEVLGTWVGGKRVWPPSDAEAP